MASPIVPKRYRPPEGPDIRVDTGVYEGAEISVYYDPMIAKLVTRGATRDAAIDRMKELGAVIVDPANIPNAATYDASELDVLLYEFKADLNAYLAGLGPSAPVRTLKDIIDYNEAHKDKEMPFFGQESFIKAEALGPLTSKEYLDALAKCAKLSRTEGIDRLLEIVRDVHAEQRPVIGDPEYEAERRGGGARELRFRLCSGLLHFLCGITDGAARRAVVHHHLRAASEQEAADEIWAICGLARKGRN